MIARVPQVTTTEQAVPQHFGGNTMNTIRGFLTSVMLAALGLPIMCSADDIDLYSGGVSTGVPNVLLVMDTGANFSGNASPGCAAYSATAGGGVPSLGTDTNAGVEQCALVEAISSLPAGTVNMGLMVYNANNFTLNAAAGVGPCVGSDGGCLLKPLTLMDATGKTTLINFIKSWTSSGSNSATAFNVKTSNEKTGSAMQEAWAYYNGKIGMSGKNYLTPIVGASCQRNFLIFIGNSFSNSSGPGDPVPDPDNSSTGLTSIQVAATDAQKIKLSNTVNFASSTCGVTSMDASTNASNWSENWADEWARYMYQKDTSSTLDGSQNIITYTIGVINNGTNTCKPDYPALLSNMAGYGGGKYFQTENADEIKNALLKILNEVQAVNSVFASSSLPVSVNTQGTYLNQIYMGMFRPDASANPRWVGNLKQYQFIYDAATQSLKLGDSTGASAVSSSGTGFIAATAISYWTTINKNTEPDLGGGFWRNQPNGTGLGYDSPDGEVVEKGGAAQRSRIANLYNDYSTAAGTSTNPRKLYTYCPSGTSCNGTLSYDPSAIASIKANVFAPSNTDITTALLGGLPPVNVSTITRSGTTATVTTSSNHGFNNGDSVTINGANQNEYNGTFIISVVNGTQFTYTVPEYPPTPATGTYTASIASSPNTITSLTRTAGTPNATATAITATPHGLAAGQNVTVSNSTYTPYNGTWVITAVPSTTQFQFIITERPLTPGSGGQVWVGTNCVTSGSGKNCVNINTILRNGTTVMITAAANLPASFTVGSTAKIVSASPTLYNSTTGYKVTGLGTNCSITNQTWNGTAFVSTTTTGTNNRSLCFTTFPSSSISPPTGLNGATASTTADTGSSATISTLTRSSTTVTATTAAPHGFANGVTVNIGGTPAANETAYIGSFSIAGVTSNTFTYQVATTPVTPATGTITAYGTTTIDRTALINWVRGEDNVGDEASPGNPFTVRPSIHGDVLHSRPVVINYGVTNGVTIGVVVFYGANDGVFRAINGNQNTAIGSVPPGGEIWGFIPKEFFGKLNRQRNNSPELLLPTTAAGITPAPQKKDYFVDGATGSYQKLNADGSTNKAYLYLTMRRGGRFIYALDVTDPANPTVLWKKGCTGSPIVCDTGFSELGQTWSRPRVAMVKGYTNPVLIFGAGYDENEDNEPPTGDSTGRGIFVLDAISGTPVWSASPTGDATDTHAKITGMNYSIPSDITFMDKDRDGYTDRLYAVDVGGNVWRVDLEPSAGNTPDKWQVTKLAALGCNAGACASGTTPRKFFFPPSVVPVAATSSLAAYDAVLVGSGDREHPLLNTNTNSAYSVTNRFYMLKDLKIGMDASGQTTITETGTAPDRLFDATSTNYDGSYRGFYITFGTGEKAVNAPLTVAGITYLGTNQPTPPSATQCSNLGDARIYGINPFTGAFGSTELDSGGMPPGPVAGITTVLKDGKQVETGFCIGCVKPCDPTIQTCTTPCNSAIEQCGKDVDGAKKLKRTYWYKK
jgi:type IV pilus assembly protein PilY1